MRNILAFFFFIKNKTFTIIDSEMDISESLSAPLDFLIRDERPCLKSSISSNKTLEHKNKKI